MNLNSRALAGLFSLGGTLGLSTATNAQGVRLRTAAILMVLLQACASAAPKPVRFTEAGTLKEHYFVDAVAGEPRWKPTLVFDDGTKTFIQFPPEMSRGEAPVLFVWRDGEPPAGQLLATLPTRRGNQCRLRGRSPL